MFNNLINDIYYKAIKPAAIEIFKSTKEEIRKLEYARGKSYSDSIKEVFKKK